MSRLTTQFVESRNIFNLGLLDLCFFYGFGLLLRLLSFLRSSDAFLLSFLDGFLLGRWWSGDRRRDVLSLAHFFRLFRFCFFLFLLRLLNLLNLTNINPLTTKNYNFLTYVQASFSWLKKRNFQTKTMFPYNFGYALQESVVKIEFGPVGNPIWRQIWRKVPKKTGIFFS